MCLVLCDAITQVALEFLGDPDSMISVYCRSLIARLTYKESPSVIMIR
jgi:hypothetical protein